MEKKEIYAPKLTPLPLREDSQTPRLSQLVLAFSRFLALSRPMKRLSRLYAYFLDEDVRPLQAVYLTYSQLFALLFLIPFECGGGWRACFFVCFCLSFDKALQKPPKGPTS